MRRASEVRVTDNHAGGGTMSILTPSCTHELRSKDGAPRTFAVQETLTVGRQGEDADGEGADPTVARAGPRHRRPTRSPAAGRRRKTDRRRTRERQPSWRRRARPL